MAYIDQWLRVHPQIGFLACSYLVTALDIEKSPKANSLRAFNFQKRQMPLVGQRRPALPRTSSAVPSALGSLTSGFGMGPGVPSLPWSLTNKGHSI